MLVYQRVYLEHLGTSWNNQSRVVNESADKNRCRTQKLCRIRASSSFGATFKPEAQTDSKTRWNLTWRWQPQTGYQLTKKHVYCSTLLNESKPFNSSSVCVWLKVLIFILDVWFHLFLWETVFRGRHGRDLTSSHRDLSLLKSSLNLCKHQGVARRKMTRTSRLSIYKSFSTVRQRSPIPNIPYILNISPFYSHYSWAVLNWRSNVVPKGPLDYHQPSRNFHDSVLAEAMPAKVNPGWD